MCEPVQPFIRSGNCWAEARIKITRMTLTIKLDRNWSSFQLANSAPPLSVTDSAIAPSARMFGHERAAVSRQRLNNSMASLLQLQEPWCNPTSFRSLASDCDNLALPQTLKTIVGTQGSLKNCISHIDASHSRQPLVKGERLVRYEVNAVMSEVRWISEKCFSWTHERVLP